MPSPTALRQGLELFRALWPHRFPDQETYDRLLAIYAVSCNELTDAEWLAACHAGLKASDHLPTPSELNRWIRPDRDPKRDPRLDYRPVNVVDFRASPPAPPLAELPPASPETIAATRAERQAEWDRMKAELRAKWDAMDAAKRANPRPGPGYASIGRHKRRRPRPEDYKEKGLADYHLGQVAANMAEGQAQWEQQQAGLRHRALNEREPQ